MVATQLGPTAPTYCNANALRKTFAVYEVYIHMKEFRGTSGSYATIRGAAPQGGGVLVVVC